MTNADISCAGHRASTDGRGMVSTDRQGRIVEHLHPLTGERCPGSGTQLGDVVIDPASGEAAS